MELWFSDYQTEKVKVSVKVQKQLLVCRQNFNVLMCLIPMNLAVF